MKLYIRLFTLGVLLCATAIGYAVPQWTQNPAILGNAMLDGGLALAIPLMIPGAAPEFGLSLNVVHGLIEASANGDPRVATNHLRQTVIPHQIAKRTERADELLVGARVVSQHEVAVAVTHGQGRASRRGLAVFCWFLGGCELTHRRTS
jgi:hypothetical protein